MACRCVQVNLYVYYILSPWKQCDFNEGSVIGRVSSFCTVILGCSGSLKAAAHAVGVQQKYARWTQRSLARIVQKSQIIFTWKCISWPGHGVPSTLREHAGTVRRFFSLDGVSERNREILQHSVEFTWLFFTSQLTRPRMCVCVYVCEVSSGSRSCRLRVFWEPSTSGSQSGAETTLTALSTRTVWWQTNSTCAQEHYSIQQQTVLDAEATL